MYKGNMVCPACDGTGTISDFMGNLMHCPVCRDGLIQREPSMQELAYEVYSELGLEEEDAAKRYFQRFGMHRLSRYYANKVSILRRRYCLNCAKADEYGEGWHACYYVHSNITGPPSAMGMLPPSLPCTRCPFYTTKYGKIDPYEISFDEHGVPRHTVHRCRNE